MEKGATKESDSGVDADLTHRLMGQYLPDRDEARASWETKSEARGVELSPTNRIMQEKSEKQRRTKSEVSNKGGKSSSASQEAVKDATTKGEAMQRVTTIT